VSGTCPHFPQTFPDHLWVLSDEASLVTGIAMPVDGGFSMV
jgi:hypothetical protein